MNGEMLEIVGNKNGMENLEITGKYSIHIFPDCFIFKSFIYFSSTFLSDIFCYGNILSRIKQRGRR